MDTGPLLPSPGSPTPGPCAGRGGAAPRPRPARCRLLPPDPLCGARLRWPSPWSSHDGGCSVAAPSPGRAVGWWARGGHGGPHRPGTNVSLCVFLTPSSPRAPGPVDPAGRPGRRPRLPLGGGPRSKFCLLACEILPPPLGLGVCYVGGPWQRCTPSRSLPFGFLTAPHPALLQAFLLRDRGCSCPPP